MRFLHLKLFFVGVAAFASIAGAEPQSCSSYAKNEGRDCRYKSGVFVKELSFNRDVFSHDSYVAFNKYRLDSEHNAFLEPYDYYYLFSVAPTDKITFSNCQDSGTFFDELFGSEETSVTALTLSVDYRLAVGTDVPGVKLLPIFMVGRGVNPTNGNNSAGCFFFPPKTVNSTYVRYTGGDSKAKFDDFQATIVGKTASQFKSNYVSTLTAIVKDISGAWPIIVSPLNLTAGKQDAVSNTAKKFEEAFNKAGAISNEWNEQIFVKAVGGRFSAWEVTVPGAAPSAKVVLYVYRSASKALESIPTKVVKRSFLLSNKRLGTPEAEYSDAAKRKTFLASFAAGNPIMNSDPLLDTSTLEARKLVYTKCNAIRKHATDVLELSTLDGALIRWAVLDDLLDELQDEKKLSLITAATGKTSAQIVDACFNTTDRNMLRGVLASLEKTLEGEKPPVVSTLKGMIKAPQSSAMSAK